MINQRSIIIFNHAISSESTKIGYLNELKRFKEFYKIRDYDSLTCWYDKKMECPYCLDEFYDEFEEY